MNYWVLEVDMDQIRSCLAQYYNHSNNTQDQRLQAEQWLTSRFQQFGHARWKQGLAMILQCANHAASGDEYVQFFGLHLLDECLLDRTWIRENSEQDRAMAKQFLFEFLHTQHTRLQRMIVNKLIKVIVEIAKLEWPEQQPDFFDHVFSICSNGETAIHGLSLLQTISEEFVSVKENLPSSRKRHLQQQLQLQLPRIMTYIHQVLKTLFSQFSQDSALFTNNKNRSKDICIASLNTLMQYMSWMQLDKYLDMQLLDTLCQLTAASLAHDQEVCVSGVSCMVEISNRNYVPREMETYLYQSFSLMMQMLQRVIANPGNLQQMADDLEHIDTDLLEKLNLFVHGFVQNHMKRVESMPNFPMAQFFELLFKYTSLQANPEDFLIILETWQAFLYYLSSSKQLLAPEAHTSLLSKYKQGLMALLEYFCKRSQFLQMGDGYLIDLDQQRKDVNSETELDQYLYQCLECIGIIVELYPLDALNIISAKYQQLVKTFQENANTRSLPRFRDASPKIQIIETVQHRQVFYLCKDIKLFMRVFSRVSALLADSFDTYMQATYGLLQQFIDIATAIFTLGLQHQGSVYAELLQETFLSLKMFQHWIQNFNSAAHAQQFNQMIIGILQLCVQALAPSGDILPEVAQEAASLFHRLAVHVMRSSTMFSYEPFQVLYQNVGKMTAAFASSSAMDYQSTISILSKLVVAFSSLILLADMHSSVVPSPSTPSTPHQSPASQQALTQEEKRKRYREFVQPLLIVPFMSTLQHGDFVQHGYRDPSVVRQVQLYLNLLTAIIGSIRSFPKDAKLIVQDNIQGVQGSMLNLFKLYIGNAAMLETLLELFQSMFDSMRTHLSPDFIGKTVESFLELISSSDNMHDIINDSSGRGKKVILQFLNLQKALCIEGSNRFVALIPKLIHVNRLIVYPLIQRQKQQQQPGQSSQRLGDLITEISPIYYDVIFNMLLNNWTHYFFTIQQAPRSEQALTDFQFLLQCFLEALQSTDINTFKQSVQHLESLNTYKKLFSREVFAKTMFMSFMKVLFDVLLRKSHALLTDEICATCFEMARCNWQPFVDHFLPQYLAQSPHLGDQQQTQLKGLFTTMGDNNASGHASMDVPTFHTRIIDFVNDYNWMSASARSTPSAPVH